MAGYPVIDPAGVDIYDEEGNLTHYDLGDTVPLSKLISRRYSWLVNRGYLSEVETDDWGSTVWGEISGTLSSQTDLQSALDAKLNLTGGTLTGLLTITSGANTFGFKNGGSSVTPQFHLGTSGGKSVGLLAGTSGTAFIYDSTGTFNITTDTKANIDAGTSSGGTVRLTMDSSGNTTLTGNLTISKASATTRISATSGMSLLSIEGIAGTWRELAFKTGTSYRWSFDVSTAAESGSNAGSNFALYRYNDAGGSIGTPILIDRATGLTTLSSLTVSGATTLSSFTSSSTATLSGSTTISGSFNIGAYNAVPTLGAELGDGVSMTQTVTTIIGTYYYVTATTLSTCTISPAGSAGETSLTIQANRTAFVATDVSHTLTGTGTGFLSVKAITAASTAAGTFVGQAIRSSAQANFGIGSDALARNFTNYTTAIGHQALQKNVTGYGNIALGYYALGGNITGLYNTSVGYGALGSLKTGGANNAFGYQALAYNVVGSGSNAFGYYAGYYQTGSYNLSMGYNAGFGSSGTTTGSYNTFVGGANTGRAFTSGSYNLALGSYAGYTGSTGTVSGSVAIGTNSSGTGAQVTANDTIVLGTSSHSTLIPGTIGSDLTISKANAFATINATSGDSGLYLLGTAGTNKVINFYSSGTSRWAIRSNNAAESGSNAGSDFNIIRYTDGGGFIDSPLTIIRQTAWAYFSANVNIAGALNVTATTDASSSTTGAMKTAGGMGIAKKLYVGTDLNVAGTIEASDVRAISQVMGAF